MQGDASFETCLPRQWCANHQPVQPHICNTVVDRNTVVEPQQSCWITTQWLDHNAVVGGLQHSCWTTTQLLACC